MDYSEEPIISNSQATQVTPPGKESLYLLMIIVTTALAIGLLYTMYTNQRETKAREQQIEQVASQRNPSIWKD